MNGDPLHGALEKDNIAISPSLGMSLWGDSAGWVQAPNEGSPNETSAVVWVWKQHEQAQCSRTFWRDPGVQLQLKSLQKFLQLLGLRDEESQVETRQVGLGPQLCASALSTCVASTTLWP